MLANLPDQLQRLSKRTDEMQAEAQLARQSENMNNSYSASSRAPHFQQRRAVCSATYEITDSHPRDDPVCRCVRAFTSNANGRKAELPRGDKGFSRPQGRRGTRVEADA